MLLKVTIVKEFNTAESADRIAFARHLANQGIRHIAPGADLRQEVSVGEDGNPSVVQVPYCTLVNTDNQAILSETPFNSSDISDAMRFYGEMPGCLARVWVSRENKDKDVDADGNPKPKGNGKRGRKSNAEKAALAAAAEEKAKAEGASVPQTPAEILAAASAAKGNKEKVKA